MRRLLALLLLVAGLVAADSAPNQPPTLTQVPLVGTIQVLEDSGPYVLFFTGVTPGLGEEGPQEDGQRIVSATVIGWPPPAGPVISEVVYDPVAQTLSALLTPAPDSYGTSIYHVILVDNGGTAHGGVNSTDYSGLYQILPVNDPPTLTVPSAVDLVQGQETAIAVTGISPGPANEIGHSLLELRAEPVQGEALAVVHVDYTSGDAIGTIVVRSRGRRAETVDLVVSVVDTSIASYDYPDASVVVTSRVVRVVVQDVPDPAELVQSRALALPSGGIWRLGTDDLQAVDPDGGEVLFRVEAGDALWRLAGVPLATGASFTQADIDAGRVSLADAGSPPGRLLACPLTLADGGMAVPVRARVTAAPVPPLLALQSGTAVWTEGAAAVAVAPAALVEDPAGIGLIGGVLRIELVEGARPGDLLSLAGDGITVTAEGGVWVDGLPVGALAAAGAAAMQIDFTVAAAVSAATAQRLLRAVRFSSSRDPGNGSRTVLVTLTNGIAAAQADAVGAATVPVDDPPVILTAAIATPAGWAREVALVAADPDDAVLAWSLPAPPAQADAVWIDAAAGRLLLLPHPGAAGADALLVAVSTPGATVAASIPIVYTTPADHRPHAAGELPWEAFAGEIWGGSLRFERADLAGAPALAFALAGDVPQGVVLTPLDDERVLVRWPVPVDAETGVHRRFAIVAEAVDGSAAGILPVAPLVRPRPAGSN